MPTYTYRCPHCKDVVEMVVPLDGRDDQYCERAAVVTDHPSAAVDECGAKLVRDEIELTARVPAAWRV